MDNASSFVVPWKKTPSKRPTEIIPPAPGLAPSRPVVPSAPRRAPSSSPRSQRVDSGWRNSPQEPSTVLSRLPTARSAVSDRSIECPFRKLRFAHTDDVTRQGSVAR
jgi:hypothetical protein